MTPIENALMRAEQWRLIGDDHARTAMEMSRKGFHTTANTTADLARRYREWAEDAEGWTTGKVPRHALVVTMLGPIPTPFVQAAVPAQEGYHATVVTVRPDSTADHVGAAQDAVLLGMGKYLRRLLG